jgi:anaerobic selenocysteine-containing dehydrogenase
MLELTRLNMNSSRRDFIKISMWGAGAAAVAGSLYSVDVFGGNKEDFNYDRPDLKRFPTYCDVCFWKCAGWTYVDDKGNNQKNYWQRHRYPQQRKIVYPRNWRFGNAFR